MILRNAGLKAGVFVSALALFPAASSCAQAGDYALRDAPNVLFTDNGTVGSIQPTQSGGVLVTGAFTHLDGVGRHGIACLDPDADVDPRPCPELRGFFDNASTPRTAFEGPDGEIYASTPWLSRREPDGSWNGVFGTTFVVRSADATPRFVGDTLTLTHAGMSPRGFAVRLSKTTGVVDASFTAEIGESDTLQAVDFDADGDLYVVYRRNGASHLARHLGTTGAIDASFAPITFDTGLGEQDVAYVAALDAVLVTGNFPRAGGGTAPLALFSAATGARLAWEPPFDGTVQDVSVEGTRASAVGMRSGSPTVYFLVDVPLDGGTSSEVVLAHPAQVVLRRGNEALVGYYSGYPVRDGGSALARFKSLAPQPVADLRWRGWVNNLLVVGEDAYVSGRFSRVDGHTTVNVARLRGGIVDTTFASTDGSFGHGEMAVDGDYLYLAAQNHMRRYALADGSRDDWTSPYDSPDVRALVKGPPGTFFIAGTFTDLPVCGAGSFTGFARIDLSGDDCTASATSAPTGLHGFHLEYDEPGNAVFALAAPKELAQPGGGTVVGANVYKLDATTGAPVAGFEAQHGFANVRAFGLGPTGVFVGGSRTLPGGYPMEEIRQLSRTTGARLGFTAQTTINQRIVVDDRAVYAASESIIGGDGPLQLERWGLASGQRDAGFSAYGTMRFALHPTQRDTVYGVGAYLYFGDEAREGVMLIGPPADLITRDSFETF